MKILIFLHGTSLMHLSGIGKTREECVQQVIQKEKSVREFSSYVPIGSVVKKLTLWREQGAEISYISSHKNKKDVSIDYNLISTYHFPIGEIYFRTGNDSYATIVEKIKPDILIEDDCESIGGSNEMIYPHIHPSIKKSIKSIVVQEFAGIDSLPDNFSELNDF